VHVALVSLYKLKDITHNWKNQGQYDTIPVTNLTPCNYMLPYTATQQGIQHMAKHEWINGVQIILTTLYHLQ
jgi:hypothetical protein